MVNISYINKTSNSSVLSFNINVHQEWTQVSLAVKMVRKVGKYGVNSGNTLRLSNQNRYLRRYGTDSCIIRRTIRSEGDDTQKYDTGLGDNDLKKDGVAFSLNKKGRWSLPELIKKEIISGDHKDDDFGIQLVERHKIANDTNCISICTSKAQSNGKKQCAKRHGYLHASNVLHRRYRYTNRARRNRRRLGLSLEDDHELPEPTQVRYDVLYPTPSSSALTRTPKYIKLDTKEGTYGLDYYSARRRTNRHRKAVSKHVIREAFSILDEEVEDSEEEADSCQDEEPRRSDNITMQDIFDQATALGPLLGIPAKTRRTSGDSARQVTTKSTKDRIFHMQKEEDGSKSTTVPEVTLTPPPVSTQVATPTSARLEPVIVILPFEEITHHALRERFGSCYIECDCFPRKFVLDISDRVSAMDKFKSYKKNVRTVNACLVFTVDTENEMNTMTDSVCTVVLNTKYSEKLKSVKIETVFDYMETHLEELTSRTLFFIDTLPDDSVLMNAATVSYRQDNGKQGHLEEIARWSTDSYTVDDAFLLQFFTSNGLKDVKDLGYEVVSHFETTVSNGGTDASSQDGKFCGICYEVIETRNPGTALISCGHWFCDICWREHLDTKIRNGGTALPCPEYDCDKIVEPGTALSLASMAAILKYSKYRHDTEVERLAVTRWCPNARCGRVLHVSSPAVKMASCVCGEQCCIDCLGKPHWPADCKSSKLFQKKVNSCGDGGIVPIEAAVGVIVNGKNCPHCHRFVEKNGGCPYMTCICGKPFCWGCGKPYSEYSHDNCHKRGYDDKHGTQERNIDPEDKLAKLKRRRWYKVALTHRVGQHPIKYKNMNTAAKTLSKKLKELITRSEQKGDPVTLDYQSPNKAYARESEKVPDFLNSIIELYRETSHLVENVAVLLDSSTRADKAQINSSLQYMVNRLAYFVSGIYELFMSADRKNVMDTLIKMKQVRLHSRNVIRALVKCVGREKI